MKQTRRPNWQSRRKKRALEGSASAQAQKDQQFHDELKKLLGF